MLKTMIYVTFTALLSLFSIAKARSTDQNIFESFYDYLDTIPALGALEFVNVTENFSDLESAEDSLTTKNGKNVLNLQYNKYSRSYSLKKIDIFTGKEISNFSLPSNLIGRLNLKLTYDKDTVLIYSIHKSRSDYFDFYFVLINAESGKIVSEYGNQSEKNMADLDVRMDKPEFSILLEDNTLNLKSLFDGKVKYSTLLTQDKQCRFIKANYTENSKITAIGSCDAYSSSTCKNSYLPIVAYTNSEEIALNGTNGQTSIVYLSRDAKCGQVSYLSKISRNNYFFVDYEGEFNVSLEFSVYLFKKNGFAKQIIPRISTRLGNFGIAIAVNKSENLIALGFTESNHNDAPLPSNIIAVRTDGSVIGSWNTKAEILPTRSINFSEDERSIILGGIILQPSNPDGITQLSLSKPADLPTVAGKLAIEKARIEKVSSLCSMGALSISQCYLLKRIVKADKFVKYPEVFAWLEGKASDEQFVNSFKQLQGLTILSVPAGASVTISGRVVGVTPLNISIPKTGLISYSMQFDQYKTYTGRAVVPENDRELVETSLNKVDEMPLQLAGVIEKDRLSLVSSTAPVARKSLIAIDRKPALPLDDIASLTGIGVYGDAATVQLASGEITSSLVVGESKSANVKVFPYKSKLYVKLAELGKFGYSFSSSPNKSIVIKFENKSLEIGAPLSNVFSDEFVASVRGIWSRSFQKAIMLDGQPAILGSSISILTNEKYKIQSGKLFEVASGKVLATAFKSVAGYRQVMVTVKDTTYLPFELFRIFGVKSNYSRGIIDLVIDDLPLSLPFLSTGRIVLTSASARASYDTAVARQVADAKAAAKREAADRIAETRQFIEINAIIMQRSPKSSYFGNDSSGRDIWGYFSNDDGYFSVAMVYAFNKDRTQWQYCFFQSAIPVTLVRASSYSGKVNAVVYSRGVNVNIDVSFSSGRCKVVAY